MLQRACASFVGRSLLCTRQHAHILSAGTDRLPFPASPIVSPPKRDLSWSSFDKYLSPEFGPIGFAQNMLETVHDTTGLPWWASIAVTTFALRSVVTLPLAVYTTSLMSRVERLQPELQDTQRRLKVEVASAMKEYKWDNRRANWEFRRNMRRLVKELYIRDNCHPLKASILAVVQLPMWISVSFALRNMAGVLPMRGHDLPVLAPAFATEGWLWFPNLLLPDATWLLPLAMAAMNLAINEMHSLKTVELKGFSKGITYFMRGLCIVMVPVAASVPSCMCWYWTCSSFFGLIQNIVIRFPSVRRTLRIKPTPSESATPFKDMWVNAQTRYGRKQKAET